MKRSTVLNLRNIKLFDFLRNNKILTLLCLCFSFGVIIGTISFSSSKTVFEFAKQWLERFYYSRNDATVGSIILSSASTSMLFLIAVFISGTSALGIMLVPLTVFLDGFIDGSFSALLYSEYQLKGIAFNAILVIPPLIIFLIGFIYASQESLNFSWAVARLTLPRSSPSVLFPYFKNYCTRYALILLVVLFSAICDAFVSKFFLPFFQI